MASTGKANWDKNFKPLVSYGPIKVPVKKDGVQGYDKNGKALDKIPANTLVEVLHDYSEKDNRVRVIHDSKEVYVRLDSLVKPKTMKSGSSLKPTDFKSITGTPTAASRLAKALIEELEEKADIEAEEREYLSGLVKYWSKIDTDTAPLKESMKNVKPDRFAVIQKYFGEIIGALACCTHGVVPNTRLSSSSKILFPTRANEPLVDYYIEDSKLPGGKLSISAKTTSSSTNTVKPDNILSLIKSAGQESKYSSTGAYEACEIIRDNTVIAAPFFLYNLVVDRSRRLPDALLQYVKKRTAADLTGKNYDAEIMSRVIDMISTSSSAGLEAQMSRAATGGRVSVAAMQKQLARIRENLPTFGELVNFIEKAAISAMNSSSEYDPTDLFKTATSGVVVYVKYESGTSNEPQGVFSVPSNDVSDTPTKLKWRSKNYAARFMDKIGIQP